MWISQVHSVDLYRAIVFLAELCQLVTRMANHVKGKCFFSTRTPKLAALKASAAHVSCRLAQRLRLYVQQLANDSKLKGDMTMTRHALTFVTRSCSNPSSSIAHANRLAGLRSRSCWQHGAATQLESARIDYRASVYVGRSIDRSTSTEPEWTSTEAD